MNIRGLLSPLLVLVCVMCTVSAQPPPPTGPQFPPHLPVNSLCATVRCGFGRVCRVVQACRFCAPRPACLPCVPRGVDSVCHRHNFLEVVLTGDLLIHVNLVARVCIPFLPGDCPVGSQCVSDGLGRGHCCYNRSPFGLPWGVTSHHPQCFGNVGGPFNLVLGVEAALSLTNE